MKSYRYFVLQYYKVFIARYTTEMKHFKVFLNLEVTTEMVVLQRHTDILNKNKNKDGQRITCRNTRNSRTTRRLQTIAIYLHRDRTFSDILRFFKKLYVTQIQDL